MRDYDEEDPKKPRPVRRPPKMQTCNVESGDLPWSHLRKDNDRDHHRHVC